MSDNLEAFFMKYAAEAEAVGSDRYVRLNMSLPAYLRESFSITKEVVALWDSGPDGQPGLKVAAARYPQAQAQRHREVLGALTYAGTLALIKPASREVVGPLVARAEHVGDEIEASCAFILDDGVEDEDDATLESLQAAEEELGAGVAAHGQLLLGWAALAEALAPKLATLGDWDPALVGEARALGEQIITAAGDGSVTRAEAERIKRIERGLLVLAHDEMRELRRVVSYVWRHHPATRQRFFSAISRTKRARQRALKSTPARLS